jgi:hypothetical protein
MYRYARVIWLRFNTNRASVSAAMSAVGLDLLVVVRPCCMYPFGGYGGYAIQMVLRTST